MRGIYYAYFLRLASLPGVLQGFVMLGILIALTRFVSLGSVLQNLSSIEFSHLGSFLYNAARNTEFLTLLLLGLFIFALLSVRMSLMPTHARYALS